MIDWSCEAFGPATRFATAKRGPLSAGCNTQGLLLYVDDVDAHCARARAAGARIVDEPTDFHLLLDRLAGFPGFLVGFLVLTLFRARHRASFRHVGRYDAAVLLSNAAVGWPRGSCG